MYWVWERDYSRRPHISGFDPQWKQDQLSIGTIETIVSLELLLLLKGSSVLQHTTKNVLDIIVKFS